MLRINEIGETYYPMLPPEGWVETPGEFEPVRAVFVTWIYSQSTYRPIFRDIVKNVAEVCKCYIIATASDSTSIKSYLISGGVPLDSIIFYEWPYNSIWIRDYGPWFMRKQDNNEGMVDFIYNRPRPLDDTISRAIGYRWAIPFYNSPLTHPGGNFMVDGLGTGFASNLIYSENTNFTARQIDSLMLIYSGLDKLVIMPRINIEYTGHIDLWTKMLNDTLVMVGSYAQGHSNYALLNSNADSISRCKNREGINYRIVRITMPYSTSDAPPTYLNSLFVNNKVLVPTWSLAEDSVGIQTYRNALPGYQIVPINCAAMSGSGGAIHCITMQIPKSEYIHIKHKYQTTTSDTLNPFRVRTQIITSSSLIPESTYIAYSMNSDSMIFTTPLNAVNDTQGVYAGYIPAWTFGDTIHYYICTKNIQGIKRNSPKSAPLYKHSVRFGSGSSIEEQVSPYTLYAYKAYPNPTFNNINFNINIDKPGKVSIELFNSLGQRIKSLVNDQLGTGVYNYQLNLADKQLPYGAYFYRIKTEQETKLGKVLYVK